MICFSDERNSISYYIILLPTVTKYHKLSSLEKQKFIVLVLKVRSPKLKCQQSWFFLRAAREILFHPSLLASSGLLAIFGIPWLVDLCLHLHEAFLCLCLCPNLPF